MHSHIHCFVLLYSNLLPAFSATTATRDTSVANVTGGNGRFSSEINHQTQSPQLNRTLCHTVLTARVQNP